MKAFKKIVVLSFVLLFQFFVSSSSACTIITATKGQRTMFGGNEDQWPNDSFLVVDISGPLRVVFIATPWDKRLLQMQMGINEKGLCYDANWIPEEEITAYPERIPQDSWVVEQLMREASSVEEVLSKIFTYNFGDTISYQVHFADQSGDAAVIHPGKNGELTFTRIEKPKGYLVSTNFNLARLANNSWFCRRYKVADKMLSNMKTEKDLTPEFMASVLKATHQNGKWKTIYSAVYDLQALNIYLYYNRQFHKPYILDVKKELANIEPHRTFSLISLRELIADIKADQ